MKQQPFLSLLSLLRELEHKALIPAIDPIEERLLYELALCWLRKRPVTVLNAMHLNFGVSPATVHRRLKTLRKKGLIRLEVQEDDSRIKHIQPTAVTRSYFERLDHCMLQVLQD